MKKHRFGQGLLLAALLVILSGCGSMLQIATPVAAVQEAEAVQTIPAYNGESLYVTVNENKPFFTAEEYTTTVFEGYSELDALGRCSVAYANICRELMPTQERGKIGMVRPSGWHTVKYDWVDGKYLYNRCHLIGFQLAGENANERNLITGTRTMNAYGMLPFENVVANYVDVFGGHVLYRVTPVFTGDNLVADGVLMEAASVEDMGKGLSFNVFCYNVEPGVVLDYKTGESKAGDPTQTAGKITFTKPVITRLDVVNAQSLSQAQNNPQLQAQSSPQTQAQVQNNPQTVASTPVSGMVWVSATGKCYHANNTCSGMNSAKAKQYTEQEAIAAGKRKCKKCW